MVWICFRQYGQLRTTTPLPPCAMLGGSVTNVSQGCLEKLLAYCGENCSFVHFGLLVSK